MDTEASFYLFWFLFGSKLHVQNNLNLKSAKLGVELRSLSEDNVLVSLTASRENGEIVYKVECSSNLTKEEFEYYLTEIIKGVCKWNKDLCKERSTKNFKGKIKPKIKSQ